MKPQFKVGDNCDTQEFGCVVIRSIYVNVADSSNFIYAVSPLASLHDEWYLQEHCLSIPV